MTDTVLSSPGKKAPRIRMYQSSYKKRAGNAVFNSWRVLKGLMPKTSLFSSLNVAAGCPGCLPHPSNPSFLQSDLVVNREALPKVATFVILSERRLQSKHRPVAQKIKSDIAETVVSMLENPLTNCQMWYHEGY